MTPEELEQRITRRGLRYPGSEVLTVGGDLAEHYLAVFHPLGEPRPE